MTGEMIKPADAERDEEYWRRKTGLFGMAALGDPGVLIRPNYPHIFDLRDMFKAEGVQCDVEPFDVYQGPFLRCEGRKTHFKVWYDSEAPPEFGNFTVETYKGGRQKFLKIQGFDVSDIENRIERLR